MGAPALEAAIITTDRLVLVPLRAEDADELCEVLDDERLHEFTGDRLASVAELHDRFVLLAAGSPRSGETWLNWVVRRRLDSQALGTVQVTLRADDGRQVARLGWMVGIPYQGQGFASEAATALVQWVRRQDVDEIGAHIHPGHHASEAVAARAGLHRTEEEFEGERVWRA
ncbi:MAG TPA: GNAT family N-acetyltransferase [Gaiellaceae bacterium]|nr:GNAT family N-acetyltransferase [Gaiellaceae bacterium]